MDSFVICLLHLDIPKILFYHLNYDDLVINYLNYDLFYLDRRVDHLLIDHQFLSFPPIRMIEDCLNHWILMTHPIIRVQLILFMII